MSNIDLSQLITPETKQARRRAEKFAKLADLRWKRETGGISLEGGMRVNTSRESQAQIAASVQSIEAGLLTEPVDWKLETGWVELTADQILTIAQAVADHVQRCFAAERRVAARMESLAGDLSDVDVAHAFDDAYDALMRAG
ncbi:DUF4376 domain-containing protein [Aquicoccus porphyridii]|uniref:DUF4376 domain-containing protein n=1 Tax=Aquicoccus porphyridii TaxID=1852029 RepID=UPI00273FD42D|nr:DUF4376 domain-containing protein [Aquicoccus porphyridii]